MWACGGRRQKLKMNKIDELYSQVWSVKDTGELAIVKEFSEDDILREIQFFNDRNNEWWISEGIEESEDGKHWLIYGFKD